MKKLCFALLLFLSVSSFARADEATKRAKIEEMIRLTKMDELLNKTMDQMSAQMKAMTSQQTANLKLSTDQQKLFDDFQAQVQKITAESLTWEKMKPVFVQLYAETYTEEELDGILTFYRSPAGQSLIAKNPQLIAKIMGATQKLMVDVQPKIEQAAQDFAQKMKELGPATK